MLKITPLLVKLVVGNEPKNRKFIKVILDTKLDLQITLRGVFKIPDFGHFEFIKAWHFFSYAIGFLILENTPILIFFNSTISALSMVKNFWINSLISDFFARWSSSVLHDFANWKIKMLWKNGNFDSAMFIFWISLAKNRTCSI